MYPNSRSGSRVKRLLFTGLGLGGDTFPHLPAQKPLIFLSFLKEYKPTVVGDIFLNYSRDVSVGLLLLNFVFLLGDDEVSYKTDDNSFFKAHFLIFCEDTKKKKKGSLCYLELCGV